MEIAIFISTILLIVTLASAILVLVKFRPKKEEAKKKPPTWPQTARSNRRLYSLLFKMREDFKADHVCIARLHNGGYWGNELPVRKFTVWMESHNPDKTDSMMKTFRDVHISEYPEVMHQLIIRDKYSCTDMKWCEDKKFHKEMQSIGFNSLFLFLIRQVDVDGTPEAFLWINYNKEKQLTTENISDITAQHNTILGYLNMTKDL